METEHNFKVGDKVRLISNLPFGIPAFAGDTGTVTDIDLSVLPINVHFDKADFSYWCRLEQLELIHELKFDVGDKVTYTGDQWHWAKVVKNGVVESVDKDSVYLCYLVIFIKDSKTGRYWLAEDDLAPYVEEKTHISPMVGGLCIYDAGFGISRIAFQAPNKALSNLYKAVGIEEWICDEYEHVVTVSYECNVTCASIVLDSHHSVWYDTRKERIFHGATNCSPSDRFSAVTGMIEACKDALWVGTLDLWNDEPLRAAIMKETYRNIRIMSHMIHQQKGSCELALNENPPEDECPF